MPFGQFFWHSKPFSQHVSALSSSDVHATELYGVPGFLYQSYQLIAYDDRLLAVSSTSFLNASELKGDTQVRA